MLCTYAPNAVLDPSTGEPVLLGYGSVYRNTDTDFAEPLMVTLPSGVQTTEVKVANGASETFSVEDVLVVIWKDAENPSLTSALEAVTPGIPPGGETGQVLRKTTPGDYDVEWGEGGGGGGGAGGPGSMVSVNEVGGTYTRPSSDPDIVYVFVGASDPGSVALENDRWERIT